MVIQHELKKMEKQTTEGGSDGNASDLEEEDDDKTEMME